MTDEQMNAAAQVVANMRRVAQYGHYDGFAENPVMRKYLERCKRVVGITPEIGCQLLFTRDAGMHACGWWKNPDYSQCLHLSLSFFHIPTRSPAPHDHKLGKQWARLFFDGCERLLWIEPPFSPEGKRWDVFHYRLFTAPDFKTPLLPRGEVYTREFTEKGWKSWSDLHSEPQETAHT